MPSTQTDRVLELVKQKGVLRSRDLDEKGLPHILLGRLHRQGPVERMGRGLYVKAGAGPARHRTLIEVCKRIPQGVVCLLSALQFHELTTQMPYQVWLALENKAWQTKVMKPYLEAVG